ncbi:hypothetical protein M2175_004006 [Bradyrhizobium elkanii]|nr:MULTISPECIES: hypothetical protein [Bradyrhizobium]MCS3928975.1 hypothetical protein [Bradyrhizobium elkanii]MCS3969531.1 hypothetical protein [Bradyrhizobium japonicum]
MSMQLKSVMRPDKLIDRDAEDPFTARASKAVREMRTTLPPVFLEATL